MFVKYLDYLFLLFLFGFFPRFIRGFLLRRHDGGHADFPANCSRFVHITQTSLQSDGEKMAGKLQFRSQDLSVVDGYMAESTESPKQQLVY